MNKLNNMNVNEINKTSNAKENAMNGSINLNNVVRFVGLKLATIVVASLIVASVSAQMYDTDPRYYPGSGPISESAFNDFRRYPNVGTTPQPVVTLETFQRWQSGVMANQANEEARVRNYVHQYDVAIYNRYVAAEQAKWQYQYTRRNEEVQAYNAAQTEMQQLKEQRRQVLNNYYVSYMNMLVEMHKYDPNRNANVNWYNQQLAAYRNAQAQNANAR